MFAVIQTKRSFCKEIYARSLYSMANSVDPNQAAPSVNNSCCPLCAV